MLRKPITYKDFNDVEVTEIFYFHLSKSELVKLEMEHAGGMAQWLQNIVNANDGKTIMFEFERIILSSYGQRSDDGRNFTKNQILRDEFQASLAYDALFMELVTNPDAAADFINGVIPKDLAEEVALLASTEEKKPDLAVVKDPILLTREDIVAMPAEELHTLGERITAGEVKLVEDPTQP
jgi:hypothetical protein